MKYDCLIVDDEIELAEATCEYFQVFGITASCVKNLSRVSGFSKGESGEGNTSGH